MTLPLPDFTNFLYNIASPPDHPKGAGWDKLKECERRLALYRWAEQINYPQRTPHHLPLPRHRVFLDDCLSAFLLTLEAASQHVGDQLQHCGKIPKRGTTLWLRGLPEHDLQMRGLRTLRHFAAHVEVKRAKRGVYIHAEKAVEIRPKYWRVTETTMSPRWLLPELDKADLHKLRSSELVDPIDLLAWNRLVINDDAASILEHGLRQAQAILLKAERLL